MASDFFTQRGSFAALSKTARAEMAVRCGADLVLELPTPWAMSPAETFARGGVRLLALAGADTLLFGSECGDLPALRCLADCLDSPTFADHLTAAPESGLTFAARRQAAAASRSVTWISDTADTSASAKCSPHRFKMSVSSQ